jgi:LysM repeat protein
MVDIYGRSSNPHRNLLVMQRDRSILTGVLIALTAACAANEPPVAEPAAPAEPRVIGEPVEPRPEPEPTLEERWAAPFAVLSSGRPAPRPAPAQVAIDGRDPVAPAAALAAAEATRAPATGGASAVRDQGSTSAPAGDGEPTPAPARVPAPAAAPAAAPPPAGTTAGTRTHRVEWGETWYGIARRYGVPSTTLAATNPGVDPERIRTGQVLRIPGADPALRAGQRSHTVGPGDSLWGIARRYGVTMERIRAANRLPDDQVRLGQTLLIPPAENSR